MGVDVVLETERREAIRSVGDPHGILARLIPSPDDKSYSLLRFVDPYGDTVFNHLQMDELLEDVAKLRLKTKGREEVQFLESVEKLALMCKKGDLRYLRFVGD